jgi:predicted nucleotidyltransferase
MNVPGTVLLSGIVGSQAYGLATPESDVDRLGMFAFPTTRLHGLTYPKESMVMTEPSDHTFHEARKFCQLVLGGNPTVTELLWLPEYEVVHGLGQQLINIRGSFLSAPRVRAAYLGYAQQQFDRLVKRDGNFSSDLKKRTEKHARHLLRLLHQGFGLYRTGELTIRLQDPDMYREFGEMVAADPTTAESELATYEELFMGTRSVLPEKPDTGPVEAWLLMVRRNFFS